MMARAFCTWWDCPLEDVAEWQDADCEKNGMLCMTCQFCNDDLMTQSPAEQEVEA